MELELEEIDLEWFKENPFWTSTLIGAGVLVALFLFVHFWIPWSWAGAAQQRANGVLNDLRNLDVESPEDEQLYNEVRGEYDEDFTELVRSFLQADSDLESFYAETREGSTFRSNYLENIGRNGDRLMESWSEQDVETGPVPDVNAYDTGQDPLPTVSDQELEGQPHLHQKRAWIMERLGQDAIDAGVNRILNISFPGFGTPDIMPALQAQVPSAEGGEEPVRNLIDQSINSSLGTYEAQDPILAEKILVEAQFATTEEQIQPLIANILNWERENEEGLHLKTEIRNMNVQKVYSVSDLLDTRFESRMEMEETETPDPDNVNVPGEDFLEQQDDLPSGEVRVDVTLEVTDYNEVTLYGMLEYLTSNNQEEIRQIFQENSPFESHHVEAFRNGNPWYN